MMRGLFILGMLAAAACTSPPVAETAEHDRLAALSAQDAPVPASLAEAYAALRGDSTSLAAQRAYFSAFPVDYAGLRREFGYEEVSEDSTRFGTYYEPGYAMIAAFFSLDRIPAEEFAAKAVGIARNGIWQADGVNYFKTFLLERITTDPPIWIGAVSMLSAAEQSSFWMFLTDGPEEPSKDDAARMRAALMGDRHQLALYDSVVALPRQRH